MTFGDGPPAKNTCTAKSACCMHEAQINILCEETSSPPRDVTTMHPKSVAVMSRLDVSLNQ
jgi:hypothetical protein